VRIVTSGLVSVSLPAASPNVEVLKIVGVDEVVASGTATIDGKDFRLPVVATPRLVDEELGLWGWDIREV
jgi:hypothetical protein